MRRRRERHKEERETFGRKGTATRYQMRQKLVSFGHDFYIENEQGQKVFKVDGKVLRVPGRFTELQGGGWYIDEYKRTPEGLKIAARSQELSFDTSKFPFLQNYETS